MAEKTVATTGEKKLATGREATRAQERYIQPPVDIYESPDGLVLLADLPGVGPGDLDVRLQDNILTIQAKALPPKHPDTIATKIGLGKMLTDKGDALQAEPLLREGLQVRQENFPPGHVLIADAESALGGCLTALKKFDEAEPLLLAAYEGMKKREAMIAVEFKVRLTEVLERIVQLCETTGDHAKADEWRRKKPAGEKLK